MSVLVHCHGHASTAAASRETAYDGLHRKHNERICVIPQDVYAISER